MKKLLILFLFFQVSVAESHPDWRSLMSPVEDQVESGCYAHCSTGMLEELLHALNDSTNVGIDLDESSIPGYGDGANYPSVALNRIENYRINLR